MIRKQLSIDPKTIFLVMTPDHGNIGDQAIALAETRILKDMGIPYIELTETVLHKMKKYRLLSIMNGRPILFNGGGYLGTIWFRPELLLRAIIKKNPDSRILFLPNTVFYEPTDWGRSEFQKSIKIYNRHRNMTLYAREHISYQIMRDSYRQVKLAPDIVLSLNGWQGRYDRQGCLLCLRNDREKTISETQEQVLRDQAGELFGDAVQDTDMVIPKVIDIAHRQESVENKLIEFSKAELVITDRLHGMILCAITGTPCIVVDSQSPKIKGCYEWIKDLPYIRFSQDVSQITLEYSHIPKQAHYYDATKLREYYDDLRRDISKTYGG